MKPVLLIDFGSTYTKVTAADVDEGRLLGTANAYTTVQSDINNGLSDALSKLEKVTGKLDFCERYAARSRKVCKPRCGRKGAEDLRLQAQ